MKNTKFLCTPLLFVLLVGFMFLAGCSVPASKVTGPKIYNLQYDIAKGVKFTWTTSGELSSITDQMGTEVVADIFSDSEDIYTVLASNKEKGLSIELEFGKRTQNVESMGGSMSTDFSDLIGKKVKFVLLPDGKVENIEGTEDLPIIVMSTGEELNKDTYSLTVETTFPTLPGRGVKIGDSWEDNQDLDIPTGNSTILSVNEFTYTVVEEVEKDGFKCLKIDMKGLSKISGDIEQQGQLLTIERETAIFGEYYFAYEERMIISGETSSNGDGVIHVPSVGIDIPQTITSKGSITVTIEK